MIGVFALDLPSPENTLSHAKAFRQGGEFVRAVVLEDRDYYEKLVVVSVFYYGDTRDGAQSSRVQRASVR